MKELMLVPTAFLTALVLFAFIHHHTKPVAFDVAAYKAKYSLRCTPDWNSLSYLLDEADIPPMPGTGTYTWKVSTKNDSAQFYFNQGINMYYGFHIIEAMASFKKAARFDPASPMLWWAQALSYGPNINDIGYNASPEAMAATLRAVSLMQNATPVEQALIHAMDVRYSNDSAQTREKLNQAYADAMKKAYEKFPGAVDVEVLYADALMLQHPWNLWNSSGTPKPWTPAIEAILEGILIKLPLHPGANHYYIHLMEPSPYAYKALPCADRLGKLQPGLSHIVHMPSHIYLRTGQFNMGTAINEEAVNQYKAYKALFPAAQEGAVLYQLHNQHMLVNCAMLAGRYKYALNSALLLHQAIDPSFLGLPAPVGSYVQYVYMTPLLVNLRFEKWDSLLQMTQPATSQVYAEVLYRFGRGMAFAAKNNVAAALQEEQLLRTLLQNADLKIPMKPFSAAYEGAICADEMLLGFIKYRQNKVEESILHFSKAVQQEENMVYDEPRDWLLNPKQYLGAAYLKAGQYEKAAVAFKKDLTVNDQNVWSLYGLWQSLQKQHKMQQVIHIRKQLDKAAVESDVDFSKLFFQ